MKRCLGLIVLLVLIGFSSCQKEIDWSTENRVATDSLYIDKLIELDTSYTSGIDTLYKYGFQYDAQKRLTQIVSIGFDDGTSNILYTSNEYRQYSGTNTVPSRIVRKEVYSNGQTFDDTTYLFYNSNNIITMDSVAGYESGLLMSISRATYAATGGGKYLVKRTQYDPTGAIVTTDSINSSRTYAGANVVSSSDSVYGLIQGGLYDVYKYTYAYDDKINPFKRVALPYPLYIDFINTYSFEYIPSPVSVNNPTSYTLMHWFAGTPNNYTGQLKYTYNSAGYPTIIRFVDASSPDTRKDILSYTSL